MLKIIHLDPNRTIAQKLKKDCEKRLKDYNHLDKKFKHVGEKRLENQS